MQATQRTGFSGSALAGLLARLSDTSVGYAGGSGADRLSQWFSWTDAISLASALDGEPVAAPSAAPVPIDFVRDECARVRQALTEAIENDCAPAPARPARPLPAGDPTAAPPPPDFAPLRRRYQTRQQAMQESIGRLRERLRERLAGHAPRLAALDAVMEHVLGAQERDLLAGLPARLEQRFKRLRDAAAAAADAAPEQPSIAWLAVLHDDMRALLLAELDLRFQPVNGLLEALRTTPH